MDYRERPRSALGPGAVGVWSHACPPHPLRRPAHELEFEARGCFEPRLGSIRLPPGVGRARELRHSNRVAPFFGRLAFPRPLSVVASLMRRFVKVRVFPETANRAARASRELSDARDGRSRQRASTELPAVSGIKVRTRTGFVVQSAPRGVRPTNACVPLRLITCGG